MSSTQWKLYGYFRSSASYRVRIALALAQLDVNSEPVHLIQDGGRQHSTEYKSINPSELVPTLETSEGWLSQSLAIIEYINDLHPESGLLPEDPWLKSQVRSFSLSLACDCQPLVNLRVQQYLRGHESPDSEVKSWLQHWMTLALSAAEESLARSGQACCFCFTDKPGMAEAVLIPQMYSADRFKVDLTPYPRLHAVRERCLSLAEFISAAPQNQADCQ